MILVGFGFAGVCYNIVVKGLGVSLMLGFWVSVLCCERFVRVALWCCVR